MSTTPITKYELWRELGRKFGIPPKGMPEYEHKKTLYKQALLNVTIAPSPITCSCPCDCEARRPRGNASRFQPRYQPPPQPMRAHVQPVHPDIDYSDYDSEDEDRSPPRRAVGGKKGRYESESDFSSSEEEEDYPPPPKKGRGRPPAVTVKKPTEKKCNMTD